jgi:hypothetical protein
VKALTISESRQSLPFLTNSSTELKQFSFKTMKWKKRWLCSRSSIDGTKASRLLRRRTIQMSESLKTTISSGSLRPIKRQKLLKSRREKEITALQSCSISREASLRRQPMWSATTMWECLTTSLRKSQHSSLLLLCLKRQVNSSKD